MRRRTAFLTALILATSGLGVLGPATAASASPCSTGWTNPSSETGVINGNGVNYRSGPWLSCDSNGQWDRYTFVYIHCRRNGTYVTINGVGSSTWYHVRRSGTQQQGWISTLLLDIHRPWPPVDPIPYDWC